MKTRHYYIINKTGQNCNENGWNVGVSKLSSFGSTVLYLK